MSMESLTLWEQTQIFNDSQRQTKSWTLVLVIQVYNFSPYLKTTILCWSMWMLKDFFCQMDSALLSEIFLIFNVSGDGSMNIQEFVLCWNKWIKKVVFAEYLSSHEIETLPDCPAKKRNHNCWCPKWLHIRWLWKVRYLHINWSKYQINI